MDTICRYYKEILKENYYVIGKAENSNFVSEKANRMSNSNSQRLEHSDSYGSCLQLKKYDSLAVSHKGESNFTDYLRL